MSGEKTVSEANTSAAIHNTYPIYKDMLDNNIVYAYRGIVSADLVAHVLTIMDDAIDGENQSKKLSKKVSNIMVECMTTVYVDEDQMKNTNYDPSAMLLVKKMMNSYAIVTGRFIPNRQVHIIKQLVDELNQLDHTQVKAYYQDKLAKEPTDQTGITSLGIIDLARKSRNPLSYFFKYVNQDYTFFSLEAKISREL
jgi:hypothetical protein